MAFVGPPPPIQPSQKFDAEEPISEGENLSPVFDLRPPPPLTFQATPLDDDFQIVGFSSPTPIAADLTPMLMDFPEERSGEEIHVVKRTWMGCKFTMGLPKAFIDHFDRFKFDDGKGKFTPIKYQSASRYQWTNEDAFCQLLIDLHQKIYGDPSPNPKVTEERLNWMVKQILPLLYNSGLQQVFNDQRWGGEFSIAMYPPPKGEKAHLLLVKRMEIGSREREDIETFREAEAIFDLRSPEAPPLKSINTQNLDWRVEKFRKPLSKFFSILGSANLDPKKDEKLLALYADLKRAHQEKINRKTSYVAFQEKHWNPFIQNLRNICEHQSELSPEGRRALQLLVRELYKNETQKNLALWLMPQLFKASNTTAYSTLDEQYRSIEKTSSWLTGYGFQLFSTFLGTWRSVFSYLFERCDKKGNLPYLHSTYPFARHDVSCLQMDSALAPELPLYIDSLGATESHLMINNQKRREEAPSSLLSPWKWTGKKLAILAERHLGYGREKERTKTLEDYAASRSDRKLTVVTLANDGPVYQQDGEGFEKEAMTYNEFKSRFIQAIATHPSYHLPDSLKKDLEHDANDILDFLYETFYKDKEELLAEPLSQKKDTFFTPESLPALSRDQRKDLIEHFNALLTFKILERTGATSYNISEGKNTALVNYWRLIFQNKWDQLEERAQFAYLLHAPALFSKPSHMIQIRSARFESAFTQLTPDAIRALSHHPTFHSFSNLFN